MTGALYFTTPAQAVRALIEAGALFSVKRRSDGLGVSFTYRVRERGDRERCRSILAHVKSRPPAFYEAFRAAVQDAVAEQEPAQEMAEVRP